MHKLITCSLWIASTLVSQAMETGRSHAEFTLDPKSLTGVASFAWQDIDAVLEIDLNKDGQLDASELDQSKSFLGDYGETLFHVQSNEETIAATSVHYLWEAAQGVITFDYHFTSDTLLQVDKLALEFTGLRDFPVGHHQQLDLVDPMGNVLATKRVGDPSARPLFPQPAPFPPAPSSNESLAAAPLAPSIHLPLTLFAAGFLAIALTGSVWFIRRMRLA